MGSQMLILDIIIITYYYIFIYTDKQNKTKAKNYQTRCKAFIKSNKNDRKEHRTERNTNLDHVKGRCTRSVGQENKKRQSLGPYIWAQRARLGTQQVTD